MACDKHIVLAVLIVTITALIVVINIAPMMEKREPNKFLKLTDDQVWYNAFKRVRSKVNSKSGKSHVNTMKPTEKMVTPKKYHQVFYLDLVEYQRYPFLKRLNENRGNNRDMIDFEHYLRRFNKSYSGREWHRRFKNFKQSLRELTLQDSTGATHGLTKFSDWSKQEFVKVMNNTSYRNYGECRFKNLKCPLKHTIEGDLIYSDQSFDADSFLSNLPDEINDTIDWRQQGNVIGPVLDQKQCNGCWAFGIVGLMESMTVIQGIEPYMRRSIQELIDCSIETEGCKSGHVSSALHFLCENDVGIETEEQYPILLVDERCKYRNVSDARKVKEFWTYCNMNESDILRRLQLGPVIVVINAQPLKNYVEGIIQRSCYRSKDGNTIDHVVQIVGYNLSGDIPYYIVKNSWGSDWGEDGYFKLKFGKELCGVNDEVTYLNVY